MSSLVKNSGLMVLILAMFAYLMPLSGERAAGVRFTFRQGSYPLPSRVLDPKCKANVKRCQLSVARCTQQMLDNLSRVSDNDSQGTHVQNLGLNACGLDESDDSAAMLEPTNAESVSSPQPFGKNKTRAVLIHGAGF